MYDEHLRTKCVAPDHYDRMIALLLWNNPSCQCIDGATTMINRCITGALEFGDFATGMCASIRTKDGKVRLFLEPISQSCTSMGHVIREAQQLIAMGG